MALKGKLGLSAISSLAKASKEKVDKVSGTVDVVSQVLHTTSDVLDELATNEDISNPELKFGDKVKSVINNVPQLKQALSTVTPQSDPSVKSLPSTIEEDIK